MNTPYEFFKTYPGHLKTATREIAERLGVTDEEVSHGRKLYLQQLQSDQNLNRKQTDLDQTFDLTLEEFCEAVGLDPNKVDRYNDVKYWTRGNGKVGLTVLPKVYQQQTFLQALQEHLDEYRPLPISKQHLQRHVCNNVAIINLTDAHIDKISFTDQHTTIEDNIDSFTKVFDKLLHRCLNAKPEEILLPAGSDFWNANDDSNETKNGTPQDNLQLSKQSFKEGVKVWRQCIDKAKQYAKVVVPLVEGNHDQDKVFYLGEVLTYLYENDPNVEILNNGHERKYYKYGKNLFGFAHGKRQKGKTRDLPLVMLEENATSGWTGQTDNRVFLLGDIHHKQEYQFLRTKDFPGVQVKFLRSISPVGNWEHDQGYIGIPKTAEAFIYNYDGDFCENYQATIKTKE